jgi:AraC-like DNA-binding protein
MEKVNSEISSLDIASSIENYLPDLPYHTGFGMQPLIKNNCVPEFALISVHRNLKNYRPVKNDHYTFILTLKGKADVTAGHHSFTLCPQTISIISPNLIYSLNKASSDLITYQLLFKKEFLHKTFVKESVIDELLYLNPDYPPVYQLENEAFNTVYQKFLMIDSEYKNSGPFHFNIIRLMLMELLYDYNRACEYCLLGFKKNMNRQYQLTYQFKKLVDSEFILRRTVADYAALLGITAKHLSETVKEETGCTALDIIHKRLILEAQYLLKHTQFTIKEITHHLHFDTTSHFSRFFKSNTKLTPLAYRNIP